MAQIKKLSMKNVRHFKGHEGESCYQGDLYYDGRKIGYYTDNFMMGPPDIDWNIVKQVDSKTRKFDSFF